MALNVAICCGCNHEIMEDENIMKCSECRNVFDLVCAGLTVVKYNALTPEFIRSWVCVTCRSKLPKSTDINTPVRLLMSNHDTGSVVTITTPTTRASTTAGVTATIPAKITGNNATLASKHYASAANTTTGNNSDEDGSNTNITIHRGGYEARKHQFSMKNAIPMCHCKCACANLESIRTIVREELQSMLRGPLIDSVSNRLAQEIGSACLKSQSTSPKLCNAVPMNDGNLTAQHIDKTDELAEGSATSLVGEKNSRRKKKSRGIKMAKSSATLVLAPRDVALKGDLPASLSQSVLATCSSSVLSSPGPPAHVGVDSRGELEESKDLIDVESSRKGLRASRPSFLSGTASPSATMLRAAERRQHLHLYYVEEGTTEDQVRAHLTTICGEDICIVEALKARGSYASFKLGVPTKFVECVLTPANWTRGICVKPWRQKFRGRGESESL